MRTRLGQIVRELRHQRGLTIVQLANQAGVARETLIALERGTANPTLATLEHIADALACSLSELIVGAEIGPPRPASDVGLTRPTSAPPVGAEARRG